MKKTFLLTKFATLLLVIAPLVVSKQGSFFLWEDMDIPVALKK